MALTVAGALPNQDMTNGLKNFENHMKRALELTEIIAAKLVIDVNQSSTSSIATQILTFLKINFYTMMSSYDINDIFQQRSKWINEKRTILMLYNLLQQKITPNMQIAIPLFSQAA
jgi:hypothetical protein